MVPLTFLLDVDNTLLNNDLLKSDLDRSLRGVIGSATDDFWRVYEDVRKSEEYVDFPATLQQFASQRPDLDQERVAGVIKSIDFASYLYPGSIEAVSYLRSLGPTVIVSDGDPVFQKRKIEESGLAAAVGGQVVLTIHKQHEMAGVFAAYPSEHYVLVDDKASILADIRRQYAATVTTVLVCQGKYARIAATPGPDLVIPHIADIVRIPSVEFAPTLDVSTARPQ